MAQEVTMNYSSAVECANPQLLCLSTSVCMCHAAYSGSSPTSPGWEGRAGLHPGEPRRVGTRK